jgi:hypothetical protein
LELIDLAQSDILQTLILKRDLRSNKRIVKRVLEE